MIRFDGRATSLVVGLGLGVCLAAALAFSGDERAELCRPGYATEQRLHGEAYRRLRDAAFARAGRAVSEQCHEGEDPRPDCLIMDHIVPICLGGLSVLDNIQLQLRAESYTKDHLEWAICRSYCAGDMSLEKAWGYFHRTPSP